MVDSLKKKKKSEQIKSLSFFIAIDGNRFCGVNNRILGGGKVEDIQ